MLPFFSHPLFFLKKICAFFKKKRKLSQSYSLGEMNNPDVLKSVEEEKLKVLELENEKAAVEGIRVIGMSKIYRKYPFGIQSDRDFTALKEVHFS